MTVGPLAFTEDITARARQVMENNYGALPDLDWPARERRAVAFVLGQTAYLRGLDGSMAEARRLLAVDLPGCDVDTWIGAIRLELSR